VLSQEDAESHRELADKLLTGEESVRVKTRVLERFAERGWALTVARPTLEKAPPPGWVVSASGAPARR
jgi:hypothetical protein